MGFNILFPPPPLRHRPAARRLAQPYFGYMVVLRGKANVACVIVHAGRNCLSDMVNVFEKRRRVGRCSAQTAVEGKSHAYWYRQVVQP